MNVMSPKLFFTNGVLRRGRILVGLAGSWVGTKLRGREYVLPLQRSPGFRILFRERIREPHPSGAYFDIALVLLFHLGDLLFQAFHESPWQWYDAILFTFPGSHNQLLSSEIDIFDSQTASFHHAKPGPVH